ncbi:MAG: hypothetical protein GXP26_02950 [Planctomycetes bacterium]|nr:hypothetical protein [Planctomycetota bacterium]
MENNVKAEVARHPYVEMVADLLVKSGNPQSTLFDLRDELCQSLGVVEKMIDKFGESVELTDSTIRPIG